jgi:hypothetical protein
LRQPGVDPRFSFMARRVPVGIVFAFLVTVVFACDDHDEFREDVVLCEEAVSYLVSCCGHGAIPTISCHYRYDANVPQSAPSNDSSEYDDGGGGGCNDKLVVPDLTIAQSKEILATSCAGLAKRCAP